MRQAHLPIRLTGSLISEHAGAESLEQPVDLQAFNEPEDVIKLI
jgi:hypothetical protein